MRSARAHRAARAGSALHGVRRGARAVRDAERDAGGSAFAGGWAAGVGVGLGVSGDGAVTVGFLVVAVAIDLAGVDGGLGVRRAGRRAQLVLRWRVGVRRKATAQERRNGAEERASGRHSRAGRASRRNRDGGGSSTSAERFRAGE